MDSALGNSREFYYANMAVSTKKFLLGLIGAPFGCLVLCIVFAVAGSYYFDPNYDRSHARAYASLHDAMLIIEDAIISYAHGEALEYPYDPDLLFGEMLEVVDRINRIKSEAETIEYEGALGNYYLAPGTTIKVVASAEEVAYFFTLRMSRPANGHSPFAILHHRREGQDFWYMSDNKVVVGEIEGKDSFVGSRVSIKGSLY